MFRDDSASGSSEHLPEAVLYPVQPAVKLLGRAGYGEIIELNCQNISVVAMCRLP